MAVLAKNANVGLVGTGTKISVPCGAADIFYEGAVVWTDETSASATVSPVTVAPATGDRILGICARQVTTTAEGDLVDIYIDGTFAIKGMTNVTRHDIGELVVFDAGTTITDNPADACRCWRHHDGGQRRHPRRPGVLLRLHRLCTPGRSDGTDQDGGRERHRMGVVIYASHSL